MLFFAEDVARRHMHVSSGHVHTGSQAPYKTKQNIEHCVLMLFSETKVRHTHKGLALHTNAHDMSRRTHECAAQQGVSGSLGVAAPSSPSFGDDMGAVSEAPAAPLDLDAHLGRNLEQKQTARTDDASGLNGL